MRLWDNIKNPLVILLSALAVISFLTGDLRATIMILAMVLLGIALRFFQEQRADKAAVVLNTGSETYFGSLASSITGQRTITSFDKGITGFNWLMIGFMAVMVPILISCARK
jgi:magnesium-transporting ATPase (P-type)